MTRKVSIDIAKGIGISLVVLGHMNDYFGAGIPGAYKFIYLFHVPLFFFLSGLFFKEKERFGDCLKKKFFRLYVPYLLANIFFFAVEMTRARLMGSAYDGNISWGDLIYAAFGLWPVLSMLSRPTWFILILFRAFLIYKLLQLVFKGNKYLMLAICVLAGVFSAIFPIEKFMIGQTLAALPFFSLGHVISAELLDNQKLFSTQNCLFIGLVSAGATYLISRYQMTNIAVNVYGNVPLYFAGAFFGIVITLCFSKLLEKCTIASKSLSLIGQYTLPILIWHIFVMKILFTIVEKGLGGSGGVYLCVLAFLVGISAPIGFSMAYNKLISRS